VDEPVTYDAYLEVERGGRYNAFVLDLPGCLASGASQNEALAALTGEIPRYYAWLKRHDEYTPEVHGPFQLVPRQMLATHPTERGEARVFFEPDGVPVDDEDMDWGTALIEWATDDLAALASRIPPIALDAALPSGGWTIRQALLHAAGAQLWFIGRLQETPGRISPEQLGSEPIAALRQTSATLIRSLRGADVATRIVSREHGGERWSLRKVLRRSVEHLREHTSQLTRDAAALGVAI
jgi:predicted RNase H-like HicB family nuclease/uncharacterized damage-inducible protein DinB